MLSRPTSRLLITLTFVCATLAVSASSASALSTLPGNPMTVHVGPRGQLQAFLVEREDGVYFAPSNQLGDAGFFLAFPVEEEVWGFNGVAGPFGLEEYLEGGQGPVTGSGAAGDPFSQVTEYGALTGGGVQVDQTTTYVNGTTEFKLKWLVTNTTGAPIKFRAFAAADFFFEGSDRGTGVFTVGPPRFIGGTNVDSGRSGGFVEVLGGGSPPWTHYQALSWPDVWNDVIETAADSVLPGEFNDTVEAEDVDNAGGVEWDQFRETGLAAGASATFELIARVGVPAALRLDPTNAGAPQGVPITVTGTAVDSNGLPYAGETLRYAITGVNPGGGAATLNAAGQAAIVDPGVNAGGDTIAAFVDFNDNGVREPSEPQASALATFFDGLRPTCKVAVKGDRPGGGGGVGSTFVVTVKCNESAEVTLKATLIVPSVRAKGSAADATASQKKKKKKIRLPKVTAGVSPGAAVPVRIKVPKGVARKYAGRTLTAKVVARVKDTAGNVSKVTKVGKIRIVGSKKGKGKGKGRGR
jgi:hypothetical protein